MTDRERILATLNHEAPDRTPADGWFHPEVRSRLMTHFATDRWEDVLDALGINCWATCNPTIHFADFEQQVNERPGKHPGWPAVWLDDRTYRNAWGVVHRRDENDWYEEYVSGPLEAAESVADIETHLLPLPGDVLAPPGYAATIRELKARDKFVSAEMPNPYKIAWLLRGMDNLLMDYLINQELLASLYDRLYALFTEYALCATRAGVDMVKIIGDIAMQDRIVMGPESWRKFDKPRMAALLSACRAMNPDVEFFIHSDGNVSDLMDDLIEIGFTVVNPIQPECMDPAAVKRRWGSKITIHGGISLQRTLPFGSVDDVRNEVETLIETCGYDGGLIAFPSNIIQPDTWVENIIECFRVTREFDVASLGRGA